MEIYNKIDEQSISVISLDMINLRILDKSIFILKWSLLSDFISEKIASMFK